MLKEIIQDTLIVWGGLFILFLATELMNVCGLDYDFGMMRLLWLISAVITYVFWVANAIGKHKRKGK